MLDDTSISIRPQFVFFIRPVEPEIQITQKDRLINVDLKAPLSAPKYGLFLILHNSMADHIISAIPESNQLRLIILICFDIFILF